jgi:hypothetical protein
VVLFTDERQLTVNSTAGPKAPDLYEYNFTRPEGERLRDLSVDATAGESADVQGVLGASEDGASVYFVANGVLGDAAAHGTTPGNCGFIGGLGGTPIGNACSLYLSHDGAISFIATLLPSDVSDWTLPIAERTARVSGDGRHLVFMSSASLTGYDNLDAKSAAPDSEVYEYSAPATTEEERAETGKLACASCNPSGARPLGSSSIPAGTPYAKASAEYQSRVLSVDGSRVFFDSGDALVAQDTNGREDVYEYEDGHVYLISSGTDSEPSEFLDASESGDNVFFVTSAQLAPEDTDQLVDLYDARVGGGSTVAPSLACTGTGCQGVPSAPPIFATPSSETFAGVGNFAGGRAPNPPAGVKPKPRKKTVKCSKGLVKDKKGKCVRKKSKKTKKARKASNKGRAK